MVLSLTVGLFSGGWGLFIIPVLGTVFLGAWPIALVLDRQGGFKALGSGIRLGRDYFWGMFVLGVAAALIGQHMTAAFGILITILVGWIIAMVVYSWYKMTLVLIYKRRRVVPLSS